MFATPLALGGGNLRCLQGKFRIDQVAATLPVIKVETAMSDGYRRFPGKMADMCLEDSQESGFGYLAAVGPDPTCNSLAGSSPTARRFRPCVTGVSAGIRLSRLCKRRGPGPCRAARTPLPAVRSASRPAGTGCRAVRGPLVLRLGLRALRDPCRLNRRAPPRPGTLADVILRPDVHRPDPQPRGLHREERALHAREALARPTAASGPSDAESKLVRIT